MISTSGLTKFYETHPAVREVSLFVPAGETCALVGPNGAGKTTLLKMLAGLLRPTSGQIEVAGVEVGAFPKRLHRIVGYVPDTYDLASATTRGLVAQGGFALLCLLLATLKYRHTRRDMLRDAGT